MKPGEIHTDRDIYRILEDGEVLKSENGGWVNIGHVEHGKVWDQRERRYIFEIEPSGVVRDLRTGKTYWIKDVEEEGGCLLILILFALIGIAIFLVLSVISLVAWLGLLTMCFALIFMGKPLRGILGFGIAALSLYLAVKTVMEGGGTPSNVPLYIACITLSWLAPLMALSKKPLYVLLAFVCFGIPVGFFALAPYAVEHYSQLYNVDRYGLGIPLLATLGGVLLLAFLFIIGIVFPIILIARAFSGDSSNGDDSSNRK